jgi:pilus assembly protein CpaB
MRLGSVLMLLAATVLAVLAGLLAQSWLEAQRRVSVPVTAQPRVPTSKIVVAAQPLRFGMELGAANLREVEWGTSTLPTGAFPSIAELLKGNERRVVLAAIEPGEPIMRWKITGPGQRAGLSSVIAAGLKAVTIRVNDVFGVAGFVLPGDRVDVLLTRAETGGDKKQFTDVLLQNVRVLAVDQLADDRSEKPAVVKAVTLEVKTQDTQKLALAGTVGSLSLALRPAGTAGAVATRRISAEDLSTARNEPSSGGQVGVRRGLGDVMLYPVPNDDAERGVEPTIIRAREGSDKRTHR